MKCEDYLAKILEDYRRHGDRRKYDIALEQTRDVCEDYDEYIEKLKFKYGMHQTPNATPEELMKLRQKYGVKEKSEDDKKS